MSDAETALDPSMPHLLHTWLPRQRWYPAKGRGVSLRRVGGYRLEDPDGEVGLRVHLVGLDSGDRLDVVQVPLTARGAPEPALAHALVGETVHSELGPRWIYDGVHDPVFVRAWLRLIADQAGVAGASGVLAEGDDAPRIDPDLPARVLQGEQSNTSVIVDGGGAADPLIVKLFRVVADGPNPDVEVTGQLSSSGVRTVPRVAGWVEGSWEVDGAPCRGHLAVASEFLPGSQDAWREAIVAVSQGDDFSSSARGLGEATAHVHLALAEAFGTSPATEEVRQQVVTGLRARVDWALTSAPALAPHTDALRHHVEALDGLEPLPDLQRVHGDYHLGQVLHSPERGWVLLDFEGEPLRPLSERVLPDLALRDVAGMLRSFDYAVRHSGASSAAEISGATGTSGAAGTVQASGDPAQQWATSCRDAFCAGYAAAGGADPTEKRHLLAALELDKALYEVVYETRNRPAWLDVPLGAVERLLA